LTYIDWSIELVIMQKIAASDFKARCLALIDEVAATGSSVVISKRGKAVAELISYTGSAEQFPQLTLRGTVTFCEGIEGPVVPADTWTSAAE
jgi:prevent-host-death family protein